MRPLTYLFFICVLACAQGFAQNPSPTPADDGDIVKITTSLIQVDVTVLDKKGNQVVGLKPENFTLLENGKPQKITNFSYIAVSSETKAEEKKKREEDTKQSRVPPVPVKIRPEQVRRTIVLLVDDLGLSYSSMHWVKVALKNFVNNQMQPDDLVAIMRTGSGIGALQQFTSDKRLLLAAISKIKWQVAGRFGLTYFEPIRPTTGDLMNGQQRGGKTITVQGNEEEKESRRRSDEERSQIFTVGTLGAIRNVITGLNTLPGRKGIILLSDGVEIYSDTLEKMRRLVDAANRAGVVINTIDPKGLVDPGYIGPENDTRGLSFEQIDALEQRRRDTFRALTGGLEYLADETGGRAIKNSNDTNGDIETILRAENGYYLIGYEPDDSTFDPKISKFNRLEVNVDQPGVKVRYRSGFFGIDDVSVKRAAQTPAQQMTVALTSPFGLKDIETRVTSVFANDAQLGNYSRALLHIDAAGLVLTDQPNGKKKVSFDIFAYVFGPEGNPLTSLTKNFAFEIQADAVDRLLAKGIIFPVNIPVTKPGAYQLRTAVRDTASGKIGSASQFIEVPDLKKERLTLSGLVVENVTLAQLKARTAGGAGAGEVPGTAKTLEDTAIRAFKRNTILIYNYVIYNAKEVQGQGTRITSYVRLFRDGKIVYESQPVPVDTSGQSDPTRIEARGVLAIGNELAPGDYVLQIVTTDTLAKEKNQVAAQSIDFEVIE